MKRYFLSEQRFARFDRQFFGRTTKDQGCVLAKSGARVTAADELSQRVLEFQQRSGDFRLFQDSIIIDHYGGDAELCAEEFAAQLQVHPVAWSIRTFTCKGRSVPFPEVLTHVPKTEVLRAARDSAYMTRSTRLLGSPIAGLLVSVVALAGFPWLAQTQWSSLGTMLRDAPLQFWSVAGFSAAIAGLLVFFALQSLRDALDWRSVRSGPGFLSGLSNAGDPKVAAFGAEIAARLRALQMPSAFIISDWHALDRFSRDAILEAAGVADDSDHVGILLWIIFRDQSAPAPDASPSIEDAFGGRLCRYTLVQAPRTETGNECVGADTVPAARIA